MAATGYVNGSPVRFENGEWRWQDNGESIKGSQRACPHCGKVPGPNGEDGCLGHLPGVVVACCGHGRREGYIIFTNGVRLDFEMVGLPTFATPTNPQTKKTWIVTETGEEL